MGLLQIATTQMAIRTRIATVEKKKEKGKEKKMEVEKRRIIRERFAKIVTLDNPPPPPN